MPVREAAVGAATPLTKLIGNLPISRFDVNLEGGSCQCHILSTCQRPAHLTAQQNWRGTVIPGYITEKTYVNLKRHISGIYVYLQLIADLSALAKGGHPFTCGSGDSE